MQRDFTRGSIVRTMLAFSLPYLLSYFLQTLYGMADLFIIGQFFPVASITAVSIGSQVMHMLTVMLVGLAMGTTVLVGKSIGSRRPALASRAIGNTITLFLPISLVLTVLLLLLVQPITAAMMTPMESVSETQRYLQLCFLGIPMITLYNVISAIFRGLGDTKSPLCFIAVACVLNIGLDFFFIGACNLGAAGAALGTVLSQTVSVVVSLLAIRRKTLLPSMHKQDFKPDRAILQSICKVGLPVALQDGLIQISFLVITVFANLRGVSDAAAVGIVEKLICLFFLVPSSMLSTVSALSSHNIGAEKHDRVKKILWCGMGMASAFGICVALSMQWLGTGLVGLFTEEAAVAVQGGWYLRSYAADCLFAGIHFCFSGYFCAYGKSGISFFHNLVSILCARIPLSYLASIWFPDNLFPMGCAAPIGSILSILICTGIYFWYQRHPERLGIYPLKGASAELP